MTPIMKFIYFIVILIIHFVASYTPKCLVEVSEGRIDCSGKKLAMTVVLVNTEEGKKIETINFSNNDIVRVEGLSRFPNVRKINLQLNLVENISTDAFSALEKLTDLDLSFNNLEYLDPYLLIKNRQLKSLSLRGNVIELSAEKPLICSASLETLNLGTCSLPAITRENLLCLPSLTELDLSSNSLTTLTPSVFSPLNKLVSINLRTNRFYCDCKLPELLKWARSLKTDMSSSDPVYCVLSNNRGGTEFEKIEKELNCSSNSTALVSSSLKTQNENSSSLKTQNENSSSEFYDYILISYDTSVQPADGHMSVRYMGIISSKLYTIEALLSLVLFLLVLITGMLFCRHYRIVGDVSDTMSEYSAYDPFLSDKMSTQLIQKSSKDHMYVHVQ